MCARHIWAAEGSRWHKPVAVAVWPCICPVHVHFDVLHVAKTATQILSWAYE